MRRLRGGLRKTLICVFSFFGSPVATSADFKLSGFATAGYAISDQDFRYLRYIDDGGTFKVDSLAGAQAEVQFDPKWGATLQLVASAPRTQDNGAEVKVRWAFVSFRPDNDWLFRVGKLRPPIFIHSQNAEVGVTFDQVRLPPEVYSLSPVYDFDGGAVTKTWSLNGSEISLDAYWGKTDLKFRLPQRDAAAVYVPEKVRATGLILSHTTDSLMLRGGAHRVTIELGDGRVAPGPFTPTPIPLPAPIGGTLYVPETTFSKFDLTVLTLGADWRAGDWRITAEYGGRILEDVKIGLGGHSGYVTLARQMGKLTPYVTHGRLISDSDTRGIYEAVNSTPVPIAAQIVPPFVPPTFHRFLADQMAVFDQYSTMLGASYSFSATSKLKFEWMRTKVGVASALVDGDVHNKSFNVFSVSYSAAF